MLTNNFNLALVVMHKIKILISKHIKMIINQEILNKRLLLRIKEIEYILKWKKLKKKIKMLDLST